MDIRIEFKPGALYKLRSDPGVKRDLESRAEAVAQACGGEDSGYATSSQQGAKSPQGRWRTTVITKSAKAMADTARNNTLLKNLDAAK